jgi:hypothetical protein
MFFAPFYPALIAAVAKIDARFAHAVDCAAKTYREKRSSTECDIYVWPMLLIHALLLTLGVLAVAKAAELLFPQRGIFLLTCALATAALMADAHQFSFLMTESVTFSLYALAMLAAVLSWTTSRSRYCAVAGLVFGALCLVRFSFLVAAMAIPPLMLINSHWVGRSTKRPALGALVFVLTFLAVILTWAARNALLVGKFGLSEEYASVTLVERFAYDQMTAREFLLAFPYCLPEIGPDLTAHLFGSDSMARFQYDRPNSFYVIGATYRWSLIDQFTRIDPIIGEVIRNEMQQNWWRYIVVSGPLAWCGMWVGGWLGFLIVPLFPAACFAALRRSNPGLLLYGAPALIMLALHALLASFYTRYNFVLIGPFCVSAAWVLSRLGKHVSCQWQIALPPSVLVGARHRRSPR